MVVGLMWERVCSVTCALNVFPDRFPEYIIILTILTGASLQVSSLFLQRDNNICAHGSKLY